MRFSSFGHFEISPWKAVGLGAALSAAASAVTALVVGGSLGGAGPAALLVVGSLTFYIVLSTPRRLLDGQRVSQARESPLLSAAAAACLTVTGSRSRTLVLIRPRDPALAASVKEAGRRVLLGERVEGAVEASARGLASYSAAAALRGVASFSASGIGSGDEEARGLASASDLGRETRIPMVTTVCFFAPIMLVLYAVFSHAYAPLKLAELSGFDFIVVDLAFYLGAPNREPP